ncbi:hypothetical protein SCL_1404 [Sulfuricaulis limicola]|uniref:Uncharacterized protein n=1 Tax=Sulfuricaulis limicola TaxID=1620215 RepID=A0A1B4XFZ8_9GAMM|nr:hypothetical protein [Sulfuricaulis limicola]BAV33715.1 hypothetical protein SCL_1404 [Sulfuricaulis limicola]
MRLLLLALSVMLAATGVRAAESARHHTVKCTPTINVWVEVDGGSLPTRETTNIENKKRVQFSLIDSAAYRGDAVLCNYATRRRDVVTSYSIRCPQPRKERGYRHSYSCN